MPFRLFFVIVKRECIRSAGRPGRHVCVVSKSGVFGKQMVFLSVFVAAERRTSIMRTIKCLKGIRWMPWR